MWRKVLRKKNLTLMPFGLLHVWETQNQVLTQMAYEVLADPKFALLLNP